jgi:hypothetical protein
MSPIDHLDVMAGHMARRAAELKKIAEAAKPFYASMDDTQKRNFGLLGREMLMAGIGYGGSTVEEMPGVAGNQADDRLTPICAVQFLRVSSRFGASPALPWRSASGRQALGLKPMRTCKSRLHASGGSSVIAGDPRVEEPGGKQSRDRRAPRGPLDCFVALARRMTGVFRRPMAPRMTETAARHAFFVAVRCASSAAGSASSSALGAAWAIAPRSSTIA